MSDVTIFHNPRCSKSRAAMHLAEQAGVAVDVVEYLKSAPTHAELLELLDILEDEPADLVRRDPEFKALGIKPEELTRERVAALLAEHPKLMERPVLVRGNRAIIGRPSERIPAFLA